MSIMVENETAENYGAGMNNGETDDDVDEAPEEAEELEEREEEAVKETKKKGKGKGAAKTVLSGRGVTLKMLVDDGILNSQEGCMSIDYLGQKFIADLLPNGKIKWEGSNKLFNSPSAWAIHCKKLVNPSKKSGCGWASVKYKGKKLDQFKTTWFRKQRPLFHSSQSSSPSLTPSAKKTSATSYPVILFPTSSEQGTSGITSPSSDSGSQMRALSSPETVQRKQDKSSTPSTSSSSKIVNSQSTTKKELSQKLKNKAQRQSKKERQENQRKSSTTASSSKPSKALESQQEIHKQSDLADLSSFNSSRKTKLVSWPRTSVNISELRPDSDPQTLVECVNFGNLKKTQPYTVSVNTNTLMLMDLHCHLTTSEVVGYLAGHWNRESQHVQVVQAFPVKCRFANQKGAETVQEEIRLAMKMRGLVLVGWYHSHPTYQPDPSVRDILAQRHYQKCLKVEGSMEEPCIAFIVSPYDPRLSSRESVIKAFWVQSGGSVNTQSSVYSLPMAMSYNIQQSGLLTDDLLTEMRQICSYYKGSPDAVDFTEAWLSGVTFLDKVKASLMRTFPKDQSSRLLCFINMLLS